MWGVFFELADKLLKFFLLKKNFVTQLLTTIVTSIFFLYIVKLFIPSVWIQNLLIPKTTFAIITIPHLELFDFYSIMGMSFIAGLFLNILYFIYKKF